MRSLALAALLCSACAIGGASFDEAGRPQVWGAAVLHAKIEACAPEKELCAVVDAEGLSEEAGQTLRSSGFLSKLREVGGSTLGWAVKKALGLIF